MKRSVKQAIAETSVTGRPARKRSKSKYAAKAAYLRTHGGWGWEYPQPKPWRGKQA